MHRPRARFAERRLTGERRVHAETPPSRKRSHRPVANVRVGHQIRCMALSYLEICMKALRNCVLAGVAIAGFLAFQPASVGAERRDRRSLALQRHAVAQRRPGARRAIAGGRRQRVAAARVLVRRHRRRRVEDHRWWFQLDADDRRQDQHLVDRLARRLPVESRRRLHRRRRDAAARQHHPGRRRLQDQRRRREVGSPHRPPRLAGDRAVARASDQLRHRLCGGARPDLQRPSAARHLQDQPTAARRGGARCSATRRPAAWISRSIRRTRT